MIGILYSFGYISLIMGCSFEGLHARKLQVDAAPKFRGLGFKGLGL